MAGKSEILLIVLVLIQCSLIQIKSETCSFTRTTDTRGYGDGVFQASNSLQQCEQQCLADSSCEATYHWNNLCYFALNTSTSPQTGSVFSLKSCTEPTTPEPTTPEPTSSDPNQGNSQQGVCVMMRKEDTTGGNDVGYKLEFTPTSCLNLCHVVDVCQSVTIGRTSCQFYTDVTTTTTILGSIHYVKTQCGDGLKCCWETQTNSAGDGIPAFVHNNTLQSCEAICGKLLRCSGVKWSNNECHVYINNPDLTPETNSIFSEKTCSTGGDTGSLTFNSICSGRNGEVQLKVNVLCYLSLLFVLFLKHILC